MTGPKPPTCGHCGQPVRRAGRGWQHEDGFYTCRIFNGYKYTSQMKFADPHYAPPTDPETYDEEFS